MSPQSALPRGWTTAPIGELIAQKGVFNDGDWVESKDQDPAGDVRLIQLADVGDGQYRDKSARFLTSEKARELNCTFLRPGDLLIARMPDPLGRACIFPGDPKASVTVVDVCIVRTANSDADHRWLQWFINSPRFRTKIAALQSGSTRKRISRGNLAKIPLPVPPPAEQHRIVAKIEELFSDLDAGVAVLTRVRAKLNRYRASVLKAAVEGRLTAAWRAAHPDVEPAEKMLKRILTERRAKWEAEQLRKYAEKGKEPPKGWKDKYSEPDPPVVGDLPSLPEHWVWTRLEQLTVMGPQNGVYYPKSRYGAGTPIIRIDDYQDFWSRPSRELQCVQAPQKDVAVYGLRPGDLVINRVNSMTHLGKCLVVTDRNLPALFESNMMRQTLASEALPEFVSYYLRSSPGKARLVDNAKWAVNQASINQTDVGNSLVPLPPLADQAEIVAEVDRRLSVVDAVETEVEHALQRAGRLRQSILKRAFEGGLVPQDPNDEPAEKLLERLRTERGDDTSKAAAKKPRATTARAKKTPARKATARPRKGRADG